MGSPREYYLLCPYTFTLVERVRGQRTLSSKATKGRRLTNMKVFFTLAALLAISFAQDPNHSEYYFMLLFILYHLTCILDKNVRHP